MMIIGGAQPLVGGDLTTCRDCPFYDQVVGLNVNAAERI